MEQNLPAEDSPIRGMEVRLAVLDEVDELLDVLADASQWLLSRGINQWPTRFDRDFIAQGIEREETYIARAEGEVAGTITLQLEDPVFWPSASGDSLYVHRVAILRRYFGLGRLLMRWAEGRATDLRRTRLRLDCWDQNLPLRRYYEGLGFKLEGYKDVVAEGRPYRTALYEKPLTAAASQ